MVGEEESAADSVVMSGAVTLLTSQSTTSTNDATGLVFFDQSFASLAAFCLSRELVGGKNPIERRCKTAAKINLVNVHENENLVNVHENENLANVHENENLANVHENENENLANVHENENLANVHENENENLANENQNQNWLEFVLIGLFGGFGTGRRQFIHLTSNPSCFSIRPKISFVLPKNILNFHDLLYSFFFRSNCKLRIAMFFFQSVMNDEDEDHWGASEREHTST